MPTDATNIILAADHLITVCFTAALYMLGGSLGVVAIWGWITKGRGL